MVDIIQKIIESAQRVGEAPIPADMKCLTTEEGMRRFIVALAQHVQDLQTQVDNLTVKSGGILSS